MEDIFSNFYIFIPIAIFIAMRILEARKKQAGSGERQDLAAALASRLNRPRPEPPESGAPGRFPAGEAAGPPREREKRASPSLLEAEAPGPVSPAPGFAAAPPPEPGVPPPRFPGSLGRLSPLKQAVAFTEILGVPRGLRRDG